MTNEGKYIARLTNNTLRSSLLDEIYALKEILKQSGIEVAVSSGVIFDLGLYATIAELRRLTETSNILDRTKQVKLEKESAKVIQEYENALDNKI